MEKKQSYIINSFYMKKLFLLFALLLTGAGCQRAEPPAQNVTPPPQAVPTPAPAPAPIPTPEPTPAPPPPAPGAPTTKATNTTSRSAIVGKFKVTLGSKNGTITSGGETQVYFQIEAKDGTPIEHVSRYGDGFGSLVVRKADTSESVQVTLPPKPSTSVYNRIPFNVTFPAPGKYTLSFEFKYGSKVYTAPFVVEVK